MFKKNRLFFVLGVLAFISFTYFITRSSSSEQDIQIAILYPLEHPSLDKIRSAFKLELTKKLEPKSVRFIEYNGSGNRLLMNQQVEQAFAKRPDLIFSITTISSSMTFAALQKNRSDIPVICGAADVRLLREAGQFPKNLFAVSDVEDYEKQLKLLKSIKPSVKKLLIVYDQGAAKYERDLSAFLRPLSEKEGIELVTLPINLPQEINQKVPLKMEGVDGIMIFKDSTVVSALESLIKIASNHHIPLYASDLDSVMKGAAIGFGLEETVTGYESAKLAGEILKQAKGSFVSEPILLKPEMLLVNRQAALVQGLEIPEDKTRESEQGAIYLESLN